MCTDKLKTAKGDTFIMTFTVSYAVAGVVLFDDSGSYIGAEYYNKENPSAEFKADQVIVTYEELSELYPAKKIGYVGFSSNQNSIFRIVRHSKTDKTGIPSIIDDLKTKTQDIYDRSSTYYTEEYTPQFLEQHGYIDWRNGNVVTRTEQTGYRVTVPQDISAFGNDMMLTITGTAQWSTCLYAIYDANMSCIATFGYNKNDTNQKYCATQEIVDINALASRYKVAKYIRFGSITEPMFRIGRRIFQNNALYGKKYVACGDSFTNNANVANYPNFIAERNGMILTNGAVSGSKMHYEEGQTAESFAKGGIDRLSSELSSADYITMMFGLNELQATVGTREDCGLSTVWGSWNTALSAIFSMNPCVKLGVIIPDGWMNTNMRNTLSSIAQYWGVPVLDLAYDPQVSQMLYSGTDGRDVNPWIVQTRNQAFSISNNHPNSKCNEFRSTIIENFLRKL